MSQVRVQVAGRDEVKASDSIAQGWRDALLESVEAVRTLPLMLSGGVDSGTILAALLELGETPHCFAFRLGREDSGDSAMAKRMASTFDLRFTLVEIERDQETLVRDSKEVIRLLGASKKAQVQCGQPVMLMAKSMRVRGYSRAIVGTGAVVMDDRRVSVILSQYGEDAARVYRESKFNDRYTDCGTGAMHAIARICGVPLEEPLSDDPVKSYGLSLSFGEMNWPKQKGIALRAFPQFWSQGFYRSNSPLQVNSGIRAWHDTLLDSEENTNGSRAVVGIYNRWRKEMEHEGTLADHWLRLVRQRGA